MSKQKVARSTFIYLVLGFLPLASAFLLTPIYTRYLNAAEYGVIALANVLQAWLSLIVSLSLDTAFSRFYFNNQDQSKTSELLSTTLITVMALSCLAAALFYFAGDRIIQLFFHERLLNFQEFGFPVLITSALGMCYTIIALYYRDAEKVRSFSIIAIIYFILLTGCTYFGVVVVKAGVAGSIYGKMAGTVLTMIIFLVVIFFRTGIKFNISLILKMLAFSLPLFVYGIMAATFDTMDRFFINKYFNLFVLGRYNFAFVIASVIGIVLASLQSAVNPSIYKMLLDKSADHSQSLNAVLKKFIWTALLFSALCITLSWLLIINFINPDYHDSLLFIPLLALSFIPRAYYMVYSYPLFTENKTVALPVVNALAVAAGIACNLILIPVIGVYGITISVVLIKTVQATGAYYFLVRLDSYDPSAFKMNKEHIASLVFATLTIVLTVADYKAYYYAALVAAAMLLITAITWQNNKFYIKRIV